MEQRTTPFPPGDNIELAAAGPRAPLDRLGFIQRVLACVVLAALVPLSGLLVLDVYGPQVEREAFANLKAIADLQAGQLENWLYERQNDGAVIMSNSELVRQVALLQHDAGNKKAYAAAREQLIASVDAVQYDAALVVDTAGKPLIEIGDHKGLSRTTAALLPHALESHQTLLGEIEAQDDGLLGLDLVVPLVQYDADGARQSVGGVLLNVRPEQFVFPYVEHWPAASVSGETLLVRRDGDDVLFINAPHAYQGGSMSLRLPLGRSADPVVAAVSGARSGTGQGPDFRGVSIFAAYRPVTGTNWVLVAKVDRSEVVAPLRRLAFWVSAIALVALGVVAAAMLLLWRQRERTLQLEMQARSDQVLRRFYDLPFIGIAVSSSAHGWLQCNDRLCEILGYTRQEMLGMTWSEMTHPDDLAVDVAQFERLVSGEIESYAIDKRFIRKDGSTVYTTMQARSVRGASGQIENYFATIQDISERKASEARLQRLTAIYAALGECNQAIVRSTGEDELFTQVCRIAVQFGGMKTAWVGLLDRESKTIYPAFSFGDHTGVIGDLRLSIDPQLAKGRGPTGVAIRELRPYWVQDFLNEPLLAPWYERGERAGWRASAALPLTCDGQAVGALILYAGEVNAFDEEIRNLLARMAQDISYALTQLARDRERREMEAALRESESRFRDLYEKAPLPYQALDLHGRLLEINDAWLNLLGYTRAEVVGRPLTDFLSNVPDEALADRFLRDYAGGPEVGPLLHFVHCDGTRRLMMVNGQIARDAEGNFLRTHSILTDLTERVHTEEQLKLAAAVFEQSPEGIMITDAAKNILMVNRAFSMITGYSAAEVLGRNPRLMSSGHHDDAFFRSVWDAVVTDGRWHGEMWDRRKDGDIYPELVSISCVLDPDGHVSHYVGIFTDISEHKANEAHIHRLAHFDALTGLPNRSLLADRVAQTLSRVERSGQDMALIFLDLDRFKNVNDSLGHRIGDELLIKVAGRLRDVLREEDTVSRLGGDEFILVLPNADADGAAHVAEKVLTVLSVPFVIEQHELNVSASLGIAMYPADGADYEALTMCADAAMYRAKQGGRSTFRFFTREMQERSERTLQLENSLRRALELEQLELHYQPQMSLADGRLIGVEALLRWTHPELGRVSPGDFIPVAEDSGLILPIGEWVLRTAVAQMRRWQLAGLPSMVLAVNLSAVQFRQARLPDLVSQILDEGGLAPRYLELELTEGVAMDNPLGAIAVMNDLHDRGVRMSIDDFGTGYSSLSYLKRFKVAKLKIDQSFVRDISTDPEDAAIVEAIIGLSRSLGLQTIAEGVETAEQLAFLRQRGCDEVQGYYVGRPMPAEAFEAFVRARQVT